MQNSIEVVPGTSHSQTISTQIQGKWASSEADIPYYSLGIPHQLPDLGDEAVVVSEISRNLFLRVSLSEGYFIDIIHSPLLPIIYGWSFHQTDSLARNSGPSKRRPFITLPSGFVTYDGTSKPKKVNQGILMKGWIFTLPKIIYNYNHKVSNILDVNAAGTPHKIISIKRFGFENSWFREQINKWKMLTDLAAFKLAKNVKS